MSHDRSRPLGDWGIAAGALNRFREARILIVGDVMIDRYVEGSVGRISPEAPVPVLHESQVRNVLGGAANVAANVAGLGGRSTLITVVGDDEPADQLGELLREVPAVRAELVHDRFRVTSLKTRYVANGQQLLRVDSESPGAISSELGRRVMTLFAEHLPHHDVVVVSDYSKGVLSDSVLASVLALCERAGVPAVVDPKRPELSCYAGATVVTPNTSEALRATGIVVDGDTSAERAVEQMLELLGGGHVLLTRGEQGMTLGGRGATPDHIRNDHREVFDVVGAGDTVVACLALALAAGLGCLQAAWLSNIAAGVAVSLSGTAAVTAPSLLRAVTRSSESGRDRDKVFSSRDELVSFVRMCAPGLRVGLTNGVFDLLHPGHLSSLREAKTHCDFLVVGINSDASVRRLKGPERPINSEWDRAALLAGMAGVDAVCIFEEDNPIALIDALRPDVFLKGADYSLDNIAGRHLVESYGGEVKLTALVPDKSSTKILNKARAGAFRS